MGGFSLEGCEPRHMSRKTKGPALKVDFLPVLCIFFILITIRVIVYELGQPLFADLIDIPGDLYHICPEKSFSAT